MSFYNLIDVHTQCLYCHTFIDVKAQIDVGYLEFHTYHLGDTVTWREHGGIPIERRPENGTLTVEAYAVCPRCDGDFWLNVVVQKDIIVSATPDLTRAGYGSLNFLYAPLTCPHCHFPAEEARIEFHFGAMRHDSYHLGDTLRWQGEGFNIPPERPPEGNYQGKGLTFCKSCHEYYNVIIHVQADRFVSVVPEDLFPPKPLNFWRLHGAT